MTDFITIGSVAFGKADYFELGVCLAVILLISSVIYINLCHTGPTRKSVTIQQGVSSPGI